MLGVISGVASVIELLAIGNGASASITSSVASQGTNTLPGMLGSPNGRGPRESGAAATLTLADSEAIAALKLPITGPAATFSGNAQVVAPSADKNASVTGITASYQAINSLTLAHGAFIDAGQVSGATRIVVLGNTLAKELFGSGQAIGQTAWIKGQAFRVIGVLNAKGSGGFSSVDDQALISPGPTPIRRRATAIATTCWCSSR